MNGELDLDAIADAAGEDEKPSRPRRKRPSDAGKRTGGRKPLAVEVRLRESIETVGGWLIDRGDEELGSVLERDAGKMALVAGKLAQQNPLAKKVVAVIADLLEPVRAFGPTLRVLWRRLLERRAHEPEPEPDEEWLSEAEIAAGAVEPEPAEPQVAEPWRLHVGE